MTYRLHPEAAMEFVEQIAVYRSLGGGLGERYSAAVKGAMLMAAEKPKRFRIECPPDIRRAKVAGFPYAVLFREAVESVQILAIAHHRRRPLYWLGRL